MRSSQAVRPAPLYIRSRAAPQGSIIAVKPVPGDFSELVDSFLATGETTDATDD